jgi:NitT/TauT family transport system substrate-binding protein
VLTTWFAQAEHGGLYQAAVTGIYKKHGLDVTVKSGGPQVNGIQLLLAGQADFIMNYDFAVLQGVERGLPLVTVAAPFQFDLQGVLAHEDVKSLGGLKDKTILVAGTGTTYWWPWLKAKYGYTDAQMRPVHVQPAAVLRRPEHRAAGVRIVGAVPGAAEGREGELPAARRRRLPAVHAGDDDDAGHVAKKPEMVARFVKATIEGWKSFMENPAPRSRRSRRRTRT